MPQKSTRIKVFLFVITSALSLPAFSQCTLKGRVTDSTHSIVPYAAVGLLNAKDSSLVTGIMSGDSGEYKFTKIKTGSYIIKVVVTGYLQQYSKPIKADSGTTIVPEIQLRNGGTALNEVRIAADKPLMERQAGKIIFNVENSIISSGKNALEMLNDLPGVSADDNANITVYGKNGVLVYVDDKPIHADLATFLKSIDASMIEKVEVITNPSAKYEASGHAVINIVLKKDKNMGLNGQLNVGYRQSVYAGFNFSPNIDYRTKKWNFYLDGSLNAFHNISQRNITETFNAGTPEQQTISNSAPYTTQGMTSYGTFGIDFTPDKKQTISYSVDGYGFVQPDKILTPNTTYVYASSGAVDSSVYSPNTRTYTDWELVNNLNYDFKIDTNGRELSANIGYMPYQSTNSQQIPVYYYNGAGDISRPSTMSTSNQPAIINVWNAQLDYTHPINKNIKIEAGLYTQRAKSDNNSQFWNVVNGVQLIDTTQSNHFLFTDNISAGYINYIQRVNDKFDFEVGLRGEQTNDIGTQYVHDTTFMRNYFNLFPSATFNWKASNASSFTLSYTRRIDRPDYDQLNPFITVVNPYTYTIGNVGLLPQLSNNFELDYSLFDAINLTLGYINTSNSFGEYWEQNDSTHVSYSIPVNYNTYNTYYAVLNIGLPITKWWTTNNTFFVYHDDYIGNYNGSNYSTTHVSFQFRTVNMFNFKHGWRCQAIFTYQSANLNGIGVRQPNSDLDVGVSKRFDDDRFTLNLNYTDVFMQNWNNFVEQYQGLNLTQQNYFDTRKIRISLIWKFGKSQYHRQDNTKKQNIQMGGAKT